MFVSNILSLVALFLVPTISWVESQTLWLLKASLCSSASSWLFDPVLFSAEHFMYTGVVKTFFFLEEDSCLLQPTMPLELLAWIKK